MSAPNRQELMTADEFLEMTDETNLKQELIDGVIIKAQAAPNERHHDIALALVFKLSEFIKKKGGNCKPFIAPFDVVLDEHQVVQPDVFVVCDPSKRDGKRINGAPDMTVEIVSSNIRDDMNRKLLLYRKYGVREYWIIDPLHNTTFVYKFSEGDVYAVYEFDEPVPVGIFGGELEINISELI